MIFLAFILTLLPFTAQDLAVPVIKLNLTATQPEVVLTSGTPFTLMCEGQAEVIWKTRLSQRTMQKISKEFLTVVESSPDHTGTYRCSYKKQTDLYSEIHIYVKDSVQVFTRPLKRIVIKKEGSDYQLDCLLTNPDATDFCLRKADGSPVPPEMNYTANPKEGIMIRNLKPFYSGDYVCSAHVNAVERMSMVFQITVKETAHYPPSVFTETNEYVRIIGEKLHITCYITNPDYWYKVTWAHSSKKELPPAENRINSSSSPVRITSVLTFHEVNKYDSGNVSCIGMNKEGVNSTTVSIRVVEKPYANLVPVPRSAVKVLEGELLELSVEIDAYPVIENHWWEKPHNTSIYEEIIHRIHKSYRYKTRLLLRRITTDESGWYIFSARSASITVSTRFEVHVYQNPSVVIKWKNDFLTCITSGYPKPRIQWQMCKLLQTTGTRCDSNHSSTVELPAKQHFLEPTKEFKPQVVESVLLPSEITMNKTVECVALNAAGEGRDIFHIRNTYIHNITTENWNSEVFITIITGTSIVIFLLLVLLGICFYRCRKKPRYEIRWKIIEANDGNNYSYINPTQLPYNQKWEFPRDRLRFGQVLGTGAFGKVVEATAYGLEKEEHVTRVAVKMLKSSAHSEEREALMSELKILSHLGPHANIVNLLGACTQGGPVLLITEFCCYGDLLNFLRRRAQSFVITVLHSHHSSSNIYKNLPIQKGPVQRQSVSYEEMHLGQRPNKLSKGSCSRHRLALDMEDMLSFSIQVAQGLEFLASKKCIHRDVAARNVLVTDRLVAKICDFGLARDIMNDPNYVVRGNARLPVKWMSPESIFECLYTVQSDVWSYGILLWEIFSLGRGPYPDVVVDGRFYEMIKGGYHMSQPDYAPPEMYTIMTMCWSLEPAFRPTYSKIIQLITKLLPEFTDKQLYRNMHQKLPQHLTSVHHVSSKAPDDPCDHMALHDAEQQQLLPQLNNYQLR